MGLPGWQSGEELALYAGDIRDAGSIYESEDYLQEGMVTHASILAWRIQWTEEPGRLVNRVAELDTTEAT